MWTQSNLPPIWKYFKFTKDIDAQRTQLLKLIKEWARQHDVQINLGIYLDKSTMEDIVWMEFCPGTPTAYLATAKQGISVLICLLRRGNETAVIQSKEQAIQCLVYVSDRGCGCNDLKEPSSSACTWAVGRHNCLLRKSNGLSWSLMSETRMVDGPSSTWAVFNLKLGPGNLILIGMREFCLDMSGIVNDFEVTKTNHKLCLFIECKNHKDSNEREILEGHKWCNPHFDRHSKIVHEIRKLNWSRI
jgi:hypothetical protein